MLNQFSRIELLIGKENLKKLNKAKVVIFGVGGVGSFVTEGIARSGIENIVLVDSDRICLTNLNRQIHATRKTIGKYKVEVMKERIKDINPNANVEIFKEFYIPKSEENQTETEIEKYITENDIDYIVDAIDTVTAKIGLVVLANKLNIPIISAMGTGNKMDPTKFEVTDIYKTEMCPLAKVMRKELKNRNIKHLKVVYSKEEPIKVIRNNDTGCEMMEMCNEEDYKKCNKGTKLSPGSMPFVPSVAGMIIASNVVKDILKNEKRK